MANDGYRSGLSRHPQKTRMMIPWLSKAPQAPQGRDLRPVVATSYLQILRTGTGHCTRPLRQTYLSVAMKTKQCRMRLNDVDVDQHDPMTLSPNDFIFSFSFFEHLNIPDLHYYYYCPATYLICPSTHALVLFEQSRSWKELIKWISGLLGVKSFLLFPLF